MQFLFRNIQKGLLKGDLQREKWKRIFFRLKKWGFLMCSKTQNYSKPFFKRKRNLVQEYSQQQSANTFFIFFSGRKMLHFPYGKGIRSWTVLRSNNIAKHLNNSLLVEDARYSEVQTLSCIAHYLTAEFLYVLDWLTGI